MAVVNPVVENRQELRPMPGQRAQAAEFDLGQTVGRAVAELGRTGQDFAEQQNELNIRYAQTAAQRARSEALRRVGEIRSRVGQAQLLDAETARQQAEGEIQSVREDIGESLQDPLARRMFQDSFETAVANDRLRMREHSDQQLRLAENAEAEATIDLSTERAVDMRGNAEAVQAERATIETNVRRRLRGAPEAAIEIATRTAISNMHRQTALAILGADEAGGGLEAMAYVREHAAEIVAEQELLLFNAIQPQYDNDVVEGVVGEIEAAVRGGEGAEPAPPAEDRPHSVSGTQYDPTRGVGRVTDGSAAHRRRSGRQAVDYAAPAGTPIYPPVAGVVASAPRQQQGNNGYMVRIRHPNGHVTTYLHLRGPSPLREGQEVTTGTVIGTVGSTGRSTGNHVDFSVRDAQGRALNPEQVTWTGDDLPAYEPQRNDLAAQYRVARRVATTRGLNSRQYAAVLQRIDQRAAREENLVRRAQDEVDRQIMIRLAQLDDNLTDISQIPSFGNASPNLQLQIRNMIRENTRASEPQAWNEAELDVDDLAYGTPEEQQIFLNTNVRALPIRREAQGRLQRQQNAIRREMRNDVSESNVAVQLGRVESAMRRAIGDPDSGADIRTGRRARDVDRRRFSQLRESVSRVVEREQRRLGRDLTDVEMDGAVRSELLRVNVHRNGRTTEAPAYEAREAREQGARVTITVPIEAERRIREELARRGVPNPTPDRITFEYRRSLIYAR